MKKIGLFISAAVLLLVSCGSEAKQEENITTGEMDTTAFLNEVKSIDSILSSQIPEKKHIKRAIVVYQEFANTFPNDPKSPDYLFQISDFYLGSGNAPKAIKTLDGIIEKYPTYNRLDAVYYARATHVDFEIRDTTLAKTYYNDILEMYPNGKYTESITSRLTTVSLSAEELIKQFEKNQAASAVQ